MQQNQSNNKDRTFKQYRLSLIEINNLSLIRPPKASLKTKALIQGIIKRNQLGLYKGNKFFIEDLSIILKQDPKNAKQILQQYHIQYDNDTVKPQCRNCGLYKPVYKYCSECQDINYCQQACEMQIKFTHQREECKPKPYPQIFPALQIEIHAGSDYGYNIEVHYQHQVRFSLQVRGQKFIDKLCDKVKTNYNQLPIGYSIEKIGKHLLCRNSGQQLALKQNEGKSQLIINTLQQFRSIYENNPVINVLELILLSQGAILNHYITEIHNNHIHLVYIFKCP